MRRSRKEHNKAWEQRNGAVVTAVTRGFALILSVAAVIGFAGCGSASQSGSASSDDVITVNNVEPAAGLVPSNTDDLAGWKVVTQLYEGLVTFSNKGKLIYADAKSITPNSDASEYTIRLRSGLRFSDGERITAETYARSWSFAANAANGQLGASVLSTIKGYDALQSKDVDKNAQLSGLAVVDDTTLKVTLSAPDSSFPYKVGDVAFLPLPASAYANITKFGDDPVGNGPYKLASWTHDKEIRLVPNPRYTGPRKARNNGVTFVLYTSLDTAYADLESGNLDVLDTIPNSALKTYRHDSSIKSFTASGAAFKAFTIAQNLPHFTGEEGRLRRQAISLAIDRRSIISKVLHGTVTAATDFTAPVIAGHSTSLSGADVLKYDATRARKLWKQANAISPWSGTFKLAYSVDSGSKQWVEAILNSISNTLGISTEPYVFSTQKEYSSAIHNRTIDAPFLQGLQSDYPHPEGYLVQAYGSASADGKGLNNGDYKSSRFDGLISRAARQTSLDGAIDYYHQAQELLLRDLPVIPLWYANVAAGASTNVRNVSFSYMGVPEYQKIVR
jgi:oligopeptide transport system substrate-binding protein